jgi:dihydroxy-acid dehydratase
LHGGAFVPSQHEAFTSPTSMFLRNLMAMDCEELVRAQPMDAVVLIGGCDKTVPALLMGAASANVPAVMTVTGPMLTGSWKGEDLGACTDCRRLWGLHRGDELTLEVRFFCSFPWFQQGNAAFAPAFCSL